MTDKRFTAVAFVWTLTYAAPTTIHELAHCLVTAAKLTAYSFLQLTAHSLHSLHVQLLTAYSLQLLTAYSLQLAYSVQLTDLKAYMQA